MQKKKQQKKNKNLWTLVLAALGRACCETTDSKPLHPAFIQTYPHTRESAASRTQTEGIRFDFPLTEGGRHGVAAVKDPTCASAFTHRVRY